LILFKEYVGPFSSVFWATSKEYNEIISKRRLIPHWHKINNTIGQILLEAFGGETHYYR
jgi:tryptophan synthase beta subunit